MNYVKGVKLNKMPEETSYLSRLPLVKDLNRRYDLYFDKPVTFFVGENGSGKSTLIEAIAQNMGFNIEGGSRDHRFSSERTVSELAEYLTVIKSTPPEDGFFLRAESFYNTANYLDENGNLKRYGGISLNAQSHGESFLSLIENRFEGHGLYIMDEPEAALSPQRLMTLITLIHDLIKRGSQFIIATHSPILMAYPNAEILQFSDSGIEKVSCRETESYRITKMFLDDPERMMHYLIDPDSN